MRKLTFLALVTLVCWGFLATAQEAIQSTMTTPDGAKIRIAHWSPPKKHNPVTTIIILQGRGSFVEKHAETVQDLLNRGYDIWTFDWRGHGGSSKVIDHPQKVHIDSFETYLKDLHQFMSEHVNPSTSGKLVFLGLSLGGHLGLRYMAEHPDAVEAGVMVAPLFDVKTPYLPRPVAEVLCHTLCSLGFGEMYAFKQTNYDPSKSTFAKTLGTRDLARFERQRSVSLKNITFVRGGVTFQWADALIDSIKTLNNSDTLQKITKPVLVVDAGQDRVVDSTADASVCTLIPDCELKTYKDAYHNILNERDEIRNEFWQDFDGFMGQKLGSIEPVL